MRLRANVKSLPWPTRSFAALGLLLCLPSGLLACSTDVTGNHGGSAASSGGSGGGSTSSTGGAGGGATPCSANVSVPTRLARIGDAQIANAIGTVFGAVALTAAGATDPTTRDFIAIQDTLNSSVLDRYVTNAENAMNAVSDATLAQLGACAGTTLDDACAAKAIGVAAEKFYRRPLTPDETASLTLVYTQASTYGIPVATRAALRAILTAPPVIYRTEFGGAPVNGTTKLTSYEVASELSFMLADTLPDDELLAAAKADKLQTTADIKSQVDRLLATSTVQANLTRIMLANYALGNLFSSAKDKNLFPAYTTDLQNSMYTETKMFVDDVLHNGKVTDLLTSRRTFIDQNLATLYGVTYPGGTGFQPFTFDANSRAGILTQASTLSIAANPDNTSVVHRGLFVHGKLMCLGVAPPPANLQAQINALSTQNITEKAKADYRAKTPPCNGCHLSFDQYGLTMEHYDAIGRYRDNYPDGTPIDASVALPSDVGGMSAAGVTEMAADLANNPIFERCVLQQLTGYGLGYQLDSNAADDCSIQAAYQAFTAAGNTGTFGDLIRAVTTSDALLVRKATP